MIEECLALFRELDDQQSIASALNILGWISLIQGDAQAARALQEEHLTIYRALGNRHGIAHAFSALGHIAFKTDDLPQAYAYFEKGLAMMTRLGDRWMVAFCMEGLARVVVAQGKAVWAAHLLSAATALREVIGAMISPLEQLAREQTLNAIHDQLNEQTFATAWSEGQAMSPEQAVAAHSPVRFSSPSVPQEKQLTNKL